MIPIPSGKPRRIDPDSDAYAQVGRRCVFCRGQVERRDITPPNMVMTAFGGDKVAHSDCVRYVQRKYPGVPLRELEGKLIRLRPGGLSGHA